MYILEEGVYAFDIFYLHPRVKRTGNWSVVTVYGEHDCFKTMQNWETLKQFFFHCM
jgi:hypothetical protein